jgi:endo-1,4-beta-xylanase
VKGVITWQLADNYSFYTDIAKKKDPLTERLPRPLPYDDRLQRKPMWYAIEQAFESAQHV